jgi:hypothetical protein
MRTVTTLCNINQGFILARRETDHEKRREYTMVAIREIVEYSTERRRI